jgi:hypothetical protein
MTGRYSQSWMKFVLLAAAILGVSAVSCGTNFSPLKKRYESTSTNSYQVSPGQLQYRTFQVDGGMSDAYLKGSFTASGGMGNDIKALVLNAENYLNWSNGHDCRTYYNSGQVTAGSFSVVLPGPGTYYLVYDNRFSLLSTKNVSENLTFGFRK